MTDENAPLRWADLTKEEREALLEMARARMFWRGLFRRASWLSGIAKALLIIGAAVTLFRDWIGEAIQWFMAGK